MAVFLDILYCTLVLYLIIGVLCAVLARVEIVQKREAKTFRDKLSRFGEGLYKFSWMYTVLVFFWPFLLRPVKVDGENIGIGFDFSSEDEDKNEKK